MEVDDVELCRAPAKELPDFQCDSTVRKVAVGSRAQAVRTHVRVIAYYVRKNGLSKNPSIVH
jgi:hypothetical protein